MKFTVVFIILTSIILVISKLIMKMIRKEDEKNGLYINEKEYTILSPLRLSRNQDKRIKKETAKKYPINEELWKKSCLLVIISASLAATAGFVFKADVAGPVIIILAAIYVYINRSYRVLLVTDILLILIMIFQGINYSFPLLISYPAMIFFTYIVRKDYKKFKTKSDTLQNNE